MLQTELVWKAEFTALHRPTDGKEEGDGNCLSGWCQQKYGTRLIPPDDMYIFTPLHQLDFEEVTFLWDLKLELRDWISLFICGKTWRTAKWGGEKGSDSISYIITEYVKHNNYKFSVSNLTKKTF